MLTSQNITVLLIVLSNAVNYQIEASRIRRVFFITLFRITVLAEQNRDLEE